MTTTTGEYRRLRGKGWHAQEAYRTAKVKRQWYEMGGHVAEERDHTEEDDRKVRLRYVPDDYAEMDNLKGDCFDPKHNRHISEKKLAEQEKEFEEVVYREGVYGIVSEFWDGEEWQHADSCWGFIGNDLKDNGYDTDAMRAAMDAYNNQSH